MWMVTGATGYVGGAALRLLAARNASKQLVGLVRDSARAEASLLPGVAWRVASYHDRPALTNAFKGIERLLFVASDGFARDALQHHTNVIEAAAATSVKHVVFLSIVDVAPDLPFYYAPVYRDAERRLFESGVEWTLLRCGLYTDFIFSHWLQPGLAAGMIEMPVRKGRMALVTRHNVAAAAASALASDAYYRQTFEITGPQALDGLEIAAALSRAFGARISYRTSDPTEYLLQAWATLEDPWPHAFSTMFVSIEQGRYAGIGSGMQDLTGHEPDSLELFLMTASHRALSNVKCS